MLGQLSKAVTSEQDDAIRADDLFRRAAFNWATSTQRLVESSTALSSNTRVAYTALVDIAYAMKLLDELFIPMTRKPLTPVADEIAVAAEEVRDCVAGVVTRVADLGRVASGVSVVDRRTHRTVDLSAPVHPWGGKMLWAGVDCSDCASVAGQRCRGENGEFKEKPHARRIAAARVQTEVN